MSISAVSIAWAFLQITLLCSLSLIIAWSLRGRRPQFVTAILAGACIASVFLALIALVPLCQWTLAISERGQSTSLNQSATEQPASAPVLKTDLHSSNKPAVESNEQSAIRSGATGPSSLETLRSLISPYLQHVDREVRDVEEWQKPVAWTRNFSLLLLVVLGLGIMSTLWYSSWFAMRRILCKSTPVDDVDLLALVRAQTNAFGLSRFPSVRESDLVPIGATVGWRHVTVLLHTDWREWSDDEKKSVVVHELAHAVRQDFAWVIISSWTRIVLFFHPMVHALIHRLRLEQELAADQLAAGRLGNAKVYGRALASLALRSQQSGRTSNPRFGSMLSAGQICVTRRVLMLKQGSLKPIQSRSRWSIWAVTAIACSAIPLAGMRGTTQEPIHDQASSKEVSKEVDTAHGAKPRPLSKEFLAAYPPLKFPGVVALRPSRLRAGEFGPEIAWLQEYFSTMVMGQPLPDQATVYGECNIRTNWLDEERAHGNFSVDASVRSADQSLQDQMRKLYEFQASLGGYPLRTLSEELVNGRTIYGVAELPIHDQPQRWMIDDEQGFFCGTLEEARQYASGALPNIQSMPDVFRQDHDNAAVSVVFLDCKTWYAKMESFYKGSPKESEFQLGMSLLKDIELVGFFIDGYKAPACNLRVILHDDRSAKNAMAKVTMLLEMAKLAFSAGSTDSDAMSTEIAKSMLETIQVKTNGAEVSLTFDIFAPSLRSQDMISCFQVGGWLNVGCHAAIGDSRDAGLTITPQETTQTMPNMFGQTLDASSYAGETVRFEAEVQCDQAYEEQAGAFALASRQEKVVPLVSSDRVPMIKSSPYVAHRTLAAVTMASDGVSAFSKSILSRRQIGSNEVAAEELATASAWKRISVQLNVPTDAEHVSFGCYTKTAKLRLRNVSFQIVNGVAANNASSHQSKDAMAEIPYNVLVVPGYPIRKEPTNLNLEQSSTEVLFEAAQTSKESTR